MFLACCIDGIDRVFPRPLTVDSLVGKVQRPQHTTDLTPQLGQCPGDLLFDVVSFYCNLCTDETQQMPARCSNARRP